MPIAENDLKFHHAQEDSDFDTGGGAKTAAVVVDGALHDLFDARAELDDVGGRVKIRKVFATADTAATNRLQRGHLALTEAPMDALVSATLFSTRDHFDRRPDHAAYIESYYVPAGRFNGFVYGTQVEGARAVELFQRETAALPEIGATYVLVQDGGTGAEVRQYVLCADIQSRIDTFTDGQGDYTRRVVTMSITTRLQQDFIGADPTRVDPAASAVRAVLRGVMVAAAAAYYGTRPLAAPAGEGQMLVEVDTPFVQLVPASSFPVAHVDLDANGRDTTLVPAGDGPVTFTTYQPFGAGAVLSLGGPFLPGSLTIQVSGATLADRNGTLYSGATPVGTADYGAGTVTGSGPSYYGGKTIAFAPAAALVDALQTTAIAVTQGTQSLVYVLTLPTAAEPGTARVAYRALGRWYELRDAGDGTLRGDDPAYGVAQLRFATRALTLSLTTLPDVDTWILVSWGMGGYSFDRGGSAIPAAAFELYTAATPQPGGVTVAWNDGAARTATDDGHGNLTGAATGTVDYSGRLITLRPDILPAPGTVFTCTLTPIAYAVETFNGLTADGAGKYPVALAHADIVAGSVAVTGTAQWGGAYGPYSPPPQNLSPNIYFHDDGAGGFVESAGSTADYAAGTLSVDRALTATAPQPVNAYYPAPSGGNSRYIFTGWNTGTLHGTLQAGPLTVAYAHGSPAAAVTETVTPAALRVDVTQTPQESVVAGSLRLSLGGRTYIDQAGAVRQVDVGAGTGVAAGSLEPSAGTVHLTAWPSGAANAPALDALAVRAGAVVVDEVTFRAPGAPVQVGSVQLAATDTLGNAITASADSTGAIAATGMAGRFYYKAGVGRVRFGDMVAAAGNEAEPWYNAADIVAGLIWKPRWVLADSIRWNCVTTGYLPADSARLGLDVNRLPPTGQVPFVEDGDLGIVHHTDTVTVGSPTAGATVDVGRTGLERLWVRDSTGARVPGDRYVADLDAGTLAWAAPLDLAGYTGPFAVYHRIMHKSYVASVDIDGRIALQLPLNRDYPEGSLFSTALETGDLQGRVERLFVQAAWDSVFRNAPIGTAPDADYNALQHPVTVSNRSTKERYALVFTSTNAFKVVSEHQGVLARDISITGDYTLLNPLTGDTEFTVYSAGWGGGWNPGNALRLDVTGASFPVEIALTIQAGTTHPATPDRFTVEFMGDIP